MARPFCFLLAPALLLGAALAQAQTTNGGFLDNTFDPVTGPGGGRQRILGAALERSTNRVLVGGDFDTFRGAARPGLVRLLPDGTVDPNFDPGSGINEPSTINQPSPGREGRVVQSVALLPNGSAFIGGTFVHYDNVFAQGVSKVTSSGFIDPTFDTRRNQSFNEENLNPDASGTPYFIPYNGVVPFHGVYVISDYPQGGDRVTVTRNVTVESLIPAPDGTLLVTYRYATKADYNIIKHGEGTEARSFTIYFLGSALKRLLGNGLLDTSFQQPFAPPFFAAEAISVEERVGGIYRTALLSDGKILIVGNFAFVNGVERPGIARLLPTGQLDATFNPASAFLPQLIYNVATQADGKLILVGDFSVVENTARRRIVRITPDGQTDTTFDTGYGPNQAVREVAVMPNGKIVVAGDFTLYNGTARAGFARLLPNGTLDATFNNSAELSGLPTPGASGAGPNADNAIFPIRVLLPQDDNKLVVAGEFTRFSATTRNRILRLTADTTGDTGGGTTPPPTVIGPARLANVSTRGLVGTGDNVLIGGLVVTGSGGSVNVLLRALGPSLAAAGVPGTLQRPVITLKNSLGVTVATNDGWQRAADGGAAVSATGLAPSSTNEAALTATLPPGAYTAIVSGSANSTGVALVEAYELTAASPAKLGNLSTRGQIGTGDSVMIGGFVVRADSPTRTKRVVVRAMGPTLATYNVAGTLSDPTLRIFDSRGTLLIANDNWNDGSQAAALRQLGRQPFDSREAAVVLELPPGAYTAIVSGVGNTTGVGLIEAYDVE